MQLLQHDKEWDAIDILTDIGVNANTITLLATRIKAKNAKRPAANRHNQTEMTEKLLECLSVRTGCLRPLMSTSLGATSLGSSRSYTGAKCITALLESRRRTFHAVH